MPFVHSGRGDERHRVGSATGTGVHTGAAHRFALELTRNNHAAATTFVRLQEENLSVPRPGPFFKLWRGSHPSLGDRVDFANHYRPWQAGQPLRYGRLFR